MKTTHVFPTSFKRSIAVLACAVLPNLVPIARAGAPANRVIATIPVGGWPYCVVVSPDSSTVYVSNYNSNTVSVIDAATNTVTFTIPTDILPNGLALSPDGSQLYVACQTLADTVDVISTASNTVTAKIALGSNNSTFAFITLTPDGSQLYSPVGTFIYLIDTATNTVSGTINNLGNPQGGYFASQVVFTPDGTDAYIVATEFGKTWLTLVDTATQSVVSTQKMGTETSFSIAINPVLPQVYVSSTEKVNGVGRCQITAVDSSTDTVLWNTTLPTTQACNGLTVTPDGKYAYILNFHLLNSKENSRVYTVDTATHKRAGKAFTVGKQAWQMAIAPNGKYGYITNATLQRNAVNGTVSVVDVQEQ
jgi:YVTN family beta-propeller protein